MFVHLASHHFICAETLPKTEHIISSLNYLNLSSIPQSGLRENHYCYADVTVTVHLVHKEVRQAGIRFR